MSNDPQLDDPISQALVSRPGIVEQKRLAGVCWMRRGNMPCGVGVGCFMFRVGIPPRYAGQAAHGAP